MVQTELETTVLPTVLIVEDEPVMRLGLRAALDPFREHVAIVGEAGNAADALELVQDLVPNLVLLDLRLPQSPSLSRSSEQHGLEAIRQIRELSPLTHVLVLSYLDKPDILFAALKAGAHGYISKGDQFAGKELINAIRRVTAGEAIFGPLIAEQMRQFFYPDGSESLTQIEPLTRREREVLQLLAQSKTNQEIADTLMITVATVKTHVRNILAKLHLRSRHQIPLVGHR